MEICQFKVYIQKDSLVMAFIDKMDELLRRLTVNPLRSPSVVRVPSFSFFLIGSMVNGIVVCSLNLAIRVKISEKAGILKSSASIFI